MAAKHPYQAYTLHLSPVQARAVNIVSAGMGLSSEELIIGAIDAAMETIKERVPEVKAYLDALPFLDKVKADAAK